MKVVILGARFDGQAKVALDAFLALRAAGTVVEVLGFLDDDESLHGSELAGFRVLGPLSLMNTRAGGLTHAHPASGSNLVRYLFANAAKAAGVPLASAIHPSAWISPLAIVGEGTLVAAGAVIQPGARVGEYCLINTSASVDHDCIVEDGVNVSPGVRLSGRVRLCRHVFLGTGATVLPDITIGEEALVAAGAVVTKNVPPGVMVAGVPAEVKRELRFEERTLPR